MTQRQLAVLLHRSPQWLSQVEADHIRPLYAELTMLAEVLRCDIHELIPLWESWEEEPPTDYSGNVCSGRPS